MLQSMDAFALRAAAAMAAIRASRRHLQRPPGYPHPGKFRRRLPQSRHPATRHHRNQRLGR